MNTERKNPVPQGKYAPAVRRGELIFTAGMTPRRDGVLLLAGRVRASEPLETYREAVRLAAANALTAAQNMLADGERIAQVLSLSVFICAEPDFTAHAKLADFASEYLDAELGAAGAAARTSVGVATLPGGAPVEIQMICAAE